MPAGQFKGDLTGLPAMAIITLTTDFGPADHYVAVMKGVILSSLPQCRIVDVTHQIRPQDVNQAAILLSQVVPYYPPGTVHVVVVDPGVGSERAVLAAVYGGQIFLAPDNGALSVVDARFPRQALHLVQNADWFCHPISATFHGRDIFAPVAARLAGGAPVSQVGPATEQMALLPWEPPKVLLDGSVRGRVIQVDSFGNLITNITYADLTAHPQAAKGEVWIGPRRIGPLCHHYAQVPRGRPVAVVGSGDFLEISINCGNAAQTFNVSVGQPVTLRPPADAPASASDSTA